MKTLIRTYLILIFASSALNAGSDNDLVVKRSGFVKEGTNFVTKSTYPQNLEGIADCMNSGSQIEYRVLIEATGEKEPAINAVN